MRKLVGQTRYYLKASIRLWSDGSSLCAVSSRADLIWIWMLKQPATIAHNVKATIAHNVNTFGFGAELHTPLGIWIYHFSWVKKIPKPCFNKTTKQLIQSHLTTGHFYFGAPLITFRWLFSTVRLICLPKLSTLNHILVWLFSTVCFQMYYI